MSTRILGIESSCDETAAAIVADGRDILSSVVASQMDIHRKYGGVVPELASRAPAADRSSRSRGTRAGGTFLHRYRCHRRDAGARTGRVAARDLSGVGAV